MVEPPYCFFLSVFFFQAFFLHFVDASQVHGQDEPLSWFDTHTRDKAGLVKIVDTQRR